MKAANRAKLQPCPFCGCTEYLKWEPLTDVRDIEIRPTIECRRCGLLMNGGHAVSVCSGGDVEGIIQLANEITIARWNTRNGNVVMPPKEVSL